MFVYQLFAVPVYLSPLARSCHTDGKGTGYIVSVSSRYFCVCYIIMYPIPIGVKKFKKSRYKIWML
ncbi:hypothetical protein HMPREF1002_04145 [Porphyromonas sp. 31_2]|nr:hypothetical protein HMPREF1002_04145 [Porphyromonas sp. 31_2]